MAFSLGVPEPWASGGWKIKIFDREWGEEPHLNFMHRLSKWRWGLRRRDFMERTPNPREVPTELVEFALRNLPRIIEAWDECHPHNPVTLREPDDE